MGELRRRGALVGLGVTLLLAACAGPDDTSAAPGGTADAPAARAGTTAPPGDAPPGTDDARGGCAVGPPLSQSATITVGSAEDAASVDPAGVGLIIGHSNAAILGTRLQRASPLYPWVNAGSSGQDSAAWASGAPETWDRADALLERDGWEAQDVQVVFVHVSRMVPAGDEADWAPIEAFADDLSVIVGQIEQRYPDASLVFLSSRLSGRFSQTANREPSAYRHGLATEQFAEGYDGPLDLVVGPYLWDDEICRRDDGLVLSESDFRERDGVHPSSTGRALIAQYIHEYLVNHPSSQPWYAPGAG